MLRLAGEIADGVMLWLCNPEYIRRVVVPEVTAGRERAGKGLEGFDIVAAVPSAVTDDPAGAFQTMREDLITYWSLPFYRAMIERSGFGAEIADRRRMSRATSTRPRRASRTTSSTRSPRSGRQTRCAQGVARYRDAGATSHA